MFGVNVHSRGINLEISEAFEAILNALTQLPISLPIGEKDTSAASQLFQRIEKQIVQNENITAENLVTLLDALSKIRFEAPILIERIGNKLLALLQNNPNLPLEVVAQGLGALINLRIIHAEKMLPLLKNLFHQFELGLESAAPFSADIMLILYKAVSVAEFYGIENERKQQLLEALNRRVQITPYKTQLDCLKVFFGQNLCMVKTDYSVLEALTLHFSNQVITDPAVFVYQWFISGLVVSETYRQEIFRKPLTEEQIAAAKRFYQDVHFRVVVMSDEERTQILPVIESIIPKPSLPWIASQVNNPIFIKSEWRLSDEKKIHYGPCQTQVLFEHSDIVVAEVVNKHNADEFLNIELPHYKWGREVVAIMHGVRFVSRNDPNDKELIVSTTKRADGENTKRTIDIIFVIRMLERKHLQRKEIAVSEQQLLEKIYLKFQLRKRLEEDQEVYVELDCFIQLIEIYMKDSIYTFLPGIWHDVLKILNEAFSEKQVKNLKERYCQNLLTLLQDNAHFFYKLSLTDLSSLTMQVLRANVSNPTKLALVKRLVSCLIEYMVNDKCKNFEQLIITLQILAIMKRSPVFGIESTTQLSRITPFVIEILEKQIYTTLEGRQLMNEPATYRLLLALLECGVDLLPWKNLILRLFKNNSSVSTIDLVMGQIGLLSVLANSSLGKDLFEEADLKKMREDCAFIAKNIPDGNREGCREIIINSTPLRLPPSLIRIKIERLFDQNKYTVTFADMDLTTGSYIPLRIHTKQDPNRKDVIVIFLSQSISESLTIPYRDIIKRMPNVQVVEVDINDTAFEIYNSVKKIWNEGIDDVQQKDARQTLALPEKEKLFIPAQDISTILKHLIKFYCHRRTLLKTESTQLRALYEKYFSAKKTIKIDNRPELQFDDFDCAEEIFNYINTMQNIEADIWIQMLRFLNKGWPENRDNGFRVEFYKNAYNILSKNPKLFDELNFDVLVQLCEQISHANLPLETTAPLLSLLMSKLVSKRKGAQSEMIVAALRVLVTMEDRKHFKEDNILKEVLIRSAKQFLTVSDGRFQDVPGACKLLGALFYSGENLSEWKDPIFKLMTRTVKSIEEDRVDPALALAKLRLFLLLSTSENLFSESERIKIRNFCKALINEMMAQHSVLATELLQNDSTLKLPTRSFLDKMVDNSPSNYHFSYYYGDFESMSVLPLFIKDRNNALVPCVIVIFDSLALSSKLEETYRILMKREPVPVITLNLNDNPEQCAKILKEQWNILTKKARKKQNKQEKSEEVLQVYQPAEPLITTTLISPNEESTAITNSTFVPEGQKTNPDEPIPTVAHRNTEVPLASPTHEDSDIRKILPVEDVHSGKVNQQTPVLLPDPIEIPQSPSEKLSNPVTPPIESDVSASNLSQGQQGQTIISPAISTAAEIKSTESNETHISVTISVSDHANEKINEPVSSQIGISAADVSNFIIASLNDPLRDTSMVQRYFQVADNPIQKVYLLLIYPDHLYVSDEQLVAIQNAIMDTPLLHETLNLLVLLSERILTNSKLQQNSLFFDKVLAVAYHVCSRAMVIRFKKQNLPIELVPDVLKRVINLFKYYVTLAQDKDVVANLEMCFILLCAHSSFPVMRERIVYSLELIPKLLKVLQVALSIPFPNKEKERHLFAIFQYILNYASRTQIEQFIQILKTPSFGLDTRLIARHLSFEKRDLRILQAASRDQENTLAFAEFFSEVFGVPNPLVAVIIRNNFVKAWKHLNTIFSDCSENTNSVILEGARMLDFFSERRTDSSNSISERGVVLSEQRLRKHLELIGDSIDVTQATALLEQIEDVHKAVQSNGRFRSVEMGKLLIDLGVAYKEVKAQYEKLMILPETERKGVGRVHCEKLIVRVKKYLRNLKARIKSEITERDSNYLKVTAATIIYFINETNSEMKILSTKKSAEIIQYWYRRTREENKVLNMIKNRESSPLAKGIARRRMGM